MRWMLLLVLGAVIGCGDSEGAADAGSPAASDAGSLADLATCDRWRGGPDLLAQRENSPAFVLDDGQVLLVSGHFDNRTGEPIDSSELVDVERDLSRLSGAFSLPHTVTGSGGTVQLDDGRVFSGSPWDETGIAAEIWDPASGEWTATGTQHVGTGPAVALPGGRVLVAGGIDWAVAPATDDHPLARAELWDPATGEWTLTGEMDTPRTGHALVITDGRALAIGGFAVYPEGPALASCEVFDALNGTWQASGAMKAPRAGPAVVLPDGRVLSAGGSTESGGYKQESASAELFDPATGEWSLVAPMHEGRSLHELTVLADGRVLATGGAQAFVSFNTESAEIFDPEAGEWSLVAPMPEAIRLHSAVLLPNGEVLVAGGYPGGYSTWIYTPCE